MKLDDTLQALFSERPDSLPDLVGALTPEIHGRLQSAVELGKWSDGTRLSPEQREYCMQLVILYEARNLPEQARTGAPLSNSCGQRSSAAGAVTIRPAGKGDT